MASYRRDNSGFWKSAPNFLIVFCCEFFPISYGLRDISSFLFKGEFPLWGRKLGGFRGPTPPIFIFVQPDSQKAHPWLITDRSMSHSCTWHKLFDLWTCRWRKKRRKEERKKGRKEERKRKFDVIFHLFSGESPVNRYSFYVESRLLLWVFVGSTCFMRVVAPREYYYDRPVFRKRRIMGNTHTYARTYTLTLTHTRSCIFINVTRL